MNKEREVFAQNLRAIIARSHLNQAQIAEKLGISRGTMSDYVHAKAYPRPARMAKLCDILGVSQYDLTTDFYQNAEDFVPNKELINLAKEIYENPDARAIYAAIKDLDTEDIRMVRTLITKLGKK